MIQYIRSGDTSLDHELFVSENLNNDCVSTYLALNFLEEFLESEKLNLRSLNPIITSQNKKSEVKWTGKKIDAIVLAFSLHHLAQFNNGTLSIAETIKHFEVFFGIDLKDYHRKWIDIKLRKEPTKFIDLMKSAIENQIHVQFKD